MPGFPRLPSTQIGPGRTDFALLAARACSHVKEEKRNEAGRLPACRGKRSVGFAAGFTCAESRGAHRPGGAGARGEEPPVGM